MPGAAPARGHRVGMALYVIGAILLVVWIVGLALKITFGAIHLALVLGLLLLVWGFVRSRFQRGAAG